MSTFARRTEIQVPPETVFDWHERPGALDRLTPPWHRVEVVKHDGIRDGDRARLKMGRRPLAIEWQVEHRGYRPGEQFVDVQISGPFASWEHIHRVVPHEVDTRASMLEDRVEYELPVSRLSQPLAGRRAERELVRMFAYRHRVTREDLERHDLARLGRLTIAVTGSTGFIGSTLVPFLTTGGHKVIRVVRSRRQQVDLACGDSVHTAYWQPERGYIDAGILEGVDAVIHLAGHPIGGGRWTRRHRARILDSRARSTRLLADVLASMRRPPRVLLSASWGAVYGHRGHDVLNEAEAPGTTFMSDVAAAWERAADRAAEGGARVCHLRLGHVLSPTGGLLGHALPALRFGLGPTVGNGRLWVPWIAMDDALYAILHLLAGEELYGPFNVCAPHPVAQRTLFGRVAKAIKRPAGLSLPDAATSLLLGQGVRQALAASTRAVPERLANSGFRFAYPHLTDALEHLLGLSPTAAP